MKPVSRTARIILRTGALLSLLAIAAEARAESLDVEGKTLQFLGEGLREFLFIDIYKLGAYSESGACKPVDIVYKNETKMMRLSMMRDIPVNRLKSNLQTTFEDNLPKKGDVTPLKNKIASFLGMFTQDLKKGDKVDIIYNPSKGTLIKRNGKPVGKATPGKDFADLVWRSYFGGNTCCKSLKADVIKACKAR